jgi:hypothetical protein
MRPSLRLAPILLVACVAAVAGCGVATVVDMPDMATAVTPPDMSMTAPMPDLVKTMDLVVLVDAPPLDDLTPLPDDMTYLPDLVPPPPPDMTMVDLRRPPDFAPPADFAEPPDLIVPPDLYGLDFYMPPMAYKYVLNGITLPLQPTDFAFDLNGDGVRDNALAGLVAALKNFGVDCQMNVDGATTLGSDIMLVRIDSTDPNLMMDLAPVVTLRSGVGKPNPDYTGLGMFSIDMMQSPAPYNGGFLVNSNYFSPTPTSGKPPVDYRLFLNLFDANVGVNLPMHGTHMQFTTGVDLKSGAPGLTDGQLQGSVLGADITKYLVPAVGKALGAVVMNNGPAAAQIEMVLDTGGCVNGNGMMAKAMDKVIDDCEVLQNNIFGMLLANDVQIFDQMGFYKPNPANLMKDSWSIGIGFTAVQAHF